MERQYPSFTSFDSSSIDSGYRYIHSKHSLVDNFEMTLAIIKPEAIKYAYEIEKIIEHEGFKVIKVCIYLW